MSLRNFFLVSLLLCGLSFSFMNFEADSGFQRTFLPLVFVVTSFVCFVIALGWLFWNLQQRQRSAFGGRRFRSDGGDGSAGGSECGWSDSWSGDAGSGDCGGGDGGGGGD